MTRAERERGQVMVLSAIAMVGLVSVVGLVTDGGSVFAARRDLQNAADAAALAGAMQIDLEAYRAEGLVVLDVDAAEAAAAEYLQGEEGMQYSIQVTEQSIDVSVSRIAGTSFLQLVGVEGVEISASSTAAPRHGISEAQE